MFRGLNDALLMRRTSGPGFPVARSRGEKEYQGSSGRNTAEFTVETANWDGRAWQGGNSHGKQRKEQTEGGSTVK